MGREALWALDAFAGILSDIHRYTPIYTDILCGREALWALDAFAGILSLNRALIEP
jgi:hypothetical protein